MASASVSCTSVVERLAVADLGGCSVSVRNLCNEISYTGLILNVHKDDVESFGWSYSVGDTTYSGSETRATITNITELCSARAVVNNRQTVDLNLVSCEPGVADPDFSFDVLGSAVATCMVDLLLAPTRAVAGAASDVSTDTIFGLDAAGFLQFGWLILLAAAALCVAALW